MQPTIGPKHVLFTHMWATVLVLGILLSGALGLTGLAVTGNLPWTTHTSRTVASSSLNPASLRAEQVKQQAAFFDAKLARLEADGLHAATQVARTAAHATLLQFYARKEERLLAFSTPAAAASDVQTIH